MTNCDVICFRAGSSIGLVAGRNGGIIEECVVSNGFLNGNGDGGGIAGTNFGTIDKCSILGGNGGLATQSGKWCFLHYEKIGSDKGTNGGHGRSWGGIAGYALHTSVISDVSVKDIHVVYYSQTSGDTDKIGYAVGDNEGLVIGSCFLKGVSSESPELKANSKYYFGVKNGFIGGSHGVVDCVVLTE